MCACNRKRPWSGSDRRQRSQSEQRDAFGRTGLYRSNVIHRSELHAHYDGLLTNPLRPFK